MAVTDWIVAATALPVVGLVANWAHGVEAKVKEQKDKIEQLEGRLDAQTVLLARVEGKLDMILDEIVRKKEV